MKCSDSFSPAIAMSHINLTAPRQKGRRNGRRQKDGAEGPANPEELIEALQQPFPVPIASLTDVPPSNAIWRWYRGKLEDDGIVVDEGEEEDASNLSCMGFFGERSKRGKADFVVMEQVEPEIVTREELERDANESARRRPDEEEEDEDDGEGEPNPLVLDHCEAFFLSYALGCLVVSDAGEELDLDAMWERFRAADPRFPALYRTYHHFRAKGWVVKRGIKFGADFLLYKHGPPFFHASYSVRVQREGGGREAAMSANFLAAINRVTETAAKELILARVAEDEEDKLISPECLKLMVVKEILVRRWVPSQERN